MDSRFEAKIAIVDALQANTYLMSLVGIYDTPVDNKPYPYVAIEASNTVPDNRHGKKGYRVYLTLGVYTKPGLLGSYQRDTIVSLIDSILNLKKFDIESGNYYMGGCTQTSVNDWVQGEIIGSNMTYTVYMYGESVNALDLSGCVMALSLYKVNENYTGPALRLRRSVDSDEMEIPYSGNYINVSLAEAFCGNSNGYVSVFYNQISGGENATQVNITTQPLLVSSGTLNSTGLYFNGTSSCMSVTSYSAINITNRPLTIYSSAKAFTGATNGFVYAYNNSAYTNTKYALRISDVYVYGYLGNSSRIQGSLVTGERQLYIWKSDGTIKLKSDAGILTGTYTTTLTSQDYFHIGTWLDPTPKNFFKGNLKSLMIFNTDEEANYNILSSY